MILPRIDQKSILGFSSILDIHYAIDDYEAIGNMSSSEKRLGTRNRTRSVVTLSTSGKPKRRGRSMVILDMNALISRVWVGDVFLDLHGGIYWYAASYIRINTDTGMIMLQLLEIP